MSKKADAIEMFVGGLLLDPNTQAPVVVLKDETGQVSLPIWIGVPEATSIASALKQVTMTRPLTHDLMADIFNELSVRVERVVITDLKDSTYFAELVLSSGDKALILDSRPSDAIGIALRAHAPIYVTQAVIDQAQIQFPQGLPVPPNQEQMQEGKGEEEEPESVEKTGVQDIAKDKWSDILDSLDPDDFKFKQ